MEMDKLLAELRDRLVNNQWSVSTAESCTSGRIASLLTTVSGSSKFFQGGIVAYQNHVKTDELGVRPETIETYDVVSQEVVTEMVKGACRKFGTTFALASTGYAEAWEGHEVEIWIGWGSSGAVHTRRLTTDNGRVNNVTEAAYQVVSEFANWILSTSND